MAAQHLGKCSCSWWWHSSNVVQWTISKN